MKFKNVSGKPQSVAGVGIVEADETREMPEGFHNANFEAVLPPKAKAKEDDKQ